MIAWLVGFWQAVWPNLAASVLWVPVTLAGNYLVVRWHHRRMRQHVDSRFNAMHRHVDITVGKQHPRARD